LEDNTGDATAGIALRIYCAHALDRRDAGFERDLTDGVVELEPGRGAAVVGQGTARPREVEGLAEASGAQASVAGAGGDPLRSAEGVEFGDGAGGEAVAAGLVAGEGLGIGERYLEAFARSPGGGGGSSGTGTDNEYVCLHSALIL